jgi:hypothetical protein
MSNKPKVRTCPCFDGNGYEAAEFCTSQMPAGVIDGVAPYALSRMLRPMTGSPQGGPCRP